MKTSRQNSALLFAILSTLVAIGVHTYLTQHYYSIKFGAGSDSICNVNDVLNCDAVAASKYSTVFGVPVAFWGLATNVILLYFLLITRFNLVQDRAKTSRYTVLLAGVTVLGSVIMGAISSTMSNICLFCLTAYALSFVGFIGTWLGSQDRRLRNFVDDIKDIFVSERWVLGFLLAVPAIAFGGNLMYMETHGYRDLQKAITHQVAVWSQSPAQNFDNSKGLVKQKGTMTPIMTIVEFADFRCSHCKHAAPSLHAFIESHPDVQLIFKPFPLDGTCNEALKQGGGDGISCSIAAAVLCSEKLQKKGWLAHDYFFEQQEPILRSSNIDTNLEEVAKMTGITLPNLQACLKDPETMSEISAMAKEGERAQIRGTPTVFVNNRLLMNGQMIPVLDGVYQNLKGN